MFKKFFKWVEEKAKGLKKAPTPEEKPPAPKPKPKKAPPAPPAKKAPPPPKLKAAKPKAEAAVPKPEKAKLKAKAPPKPEKPLPKPAATRLRPPAARSLRRTGRSEAPASPRREPAPKPAPEAKPAPLPPEKPSAKKPAEAPVAAREEKPAPSEAPPPATPEAMPLVTPEPEAVPKPVEALPVEEKPTGWLKRLKQKLTKSSSRVSEGITRIFTTRKLDSASLEELEDLLISSDLGVETAARVTEALAKRRVEKKISPDEVRRVLAGEIAAILKPAAKDLDVERGFKPHIILMVGVNGTGKTTTIGKMAQMLKIMGKKVMVAAGDTFRAAAIEQLEVWAERAGVPIIKGEIGGDAASVAYAAIDAAKEQDIDVLIIDTAGRLQNRTELMDELAKIVRVIRKKDETAPHDTILVLDATTGQNALLQAQVFLEAANVSGIIMTKLDGTAKGGILVACTEKFHLPVYGIGVGETLEDLQPFDPEGFASALAGLEAGEAVAS